MRVSRLMSAGTQAVIMDLAAYCCALRSRVGRARVLLLKFLDDDSLASIMATSALRSAVAVFLKEQLDSSSRINT